MLTRCLLKFCRIFLFKEWMANLNKKEDYGIELTTVVSVALVVRSSTPHWVLGRVGKYRM